jgi:predicted phage-related endonuclease
MNKYTKIKDFHGERAKGVGSSDIPTLAGLSRRYGSTSLTLWQQKTGRAEPWAGNNRTEWGHKLEGLVLREFLVSRYGEDVADEFLTAKRRGRSAGAFKTDTEARHPDRPYCLAHADLLVDGPVQTPDGQTFATDDGRPPEYIVEAKTAGMMSGKRREGQIFTGYDPDDRSAQGIPDAVFLQVQWQMYCYGVNLAWVAVLIDTADYREYGPIVADARVQEKCLALAERFWRLVESDTAPAPETWDDVQALFPHQDDTTAMISGNDEQRVRKMIAEDKALAERAKAIDERRDDIKNAIGILIGANSVLASGEGDVLAKTSETTRESVSLGDLKKKAPDIERQIREAGLVKASTFRTVRF